MRRAGAKLVEVGTTNRTRAATSRRPSRTAARGWCCGSIPRTSARPGSSRHPMAGVGGRRAPARRARRRRPRQRRAARYRRVRAGPRADAGRAAGRGRRPRDVQRRQARWRATGRVHRRTRRPRGAPPEGSAGRTSAGQVGPCRVAATLALYRAGVATRDIPVWRQISRRSMVCMPAPKRSWRRAGSVQVVETEATVGGGSLPGQLLPSRGRLSAGRRPDALLARLPPGRRPSSGESSTAMWSSTRASVERGDDEALAGARAALAGDG